ncbi:MAG: PKD domain-containing protein, partial [Flavobacteriales bacterium]|nr:PKD domain-containing protein [Flavobacteriales bacterium]
TKTSYVSVAAGTPTAACTPGSQNGPGNYGYTLSNVTFETINNTTSSGSNGVYADYSCTYATSVTEGSSYNLSVTLYTNNTYSEDVEVYIDYNDDGTFSAGELIMSKTLASGGGNQTFTESILIPGTATMSKVLRMRVHADANGVGSVCNQTFVGDIEDYGVYINPLVLCTDPDVPTISGTTTICNGNNTTLSIASGNLNDAIDWQWYTVSCGGTSVGSGTSINVSPTNTITYYVRGEGGCVTPGSCTSVTVTVNDVPSAAGAIAGSTTECENETGVPYSISAVSGATGYVWSAPPGATINGTGTSITIDFGNTSGNVSVTPNNSCGNGGSSNEFVTINSCGLAPVAGFSGNPQALCEGSTVSFTDLSTNTPTSWSWTFTGGSPTSSTSQNPTITYNTAGTYQVILTATNASGSDIETKVGYITVNSCGVTQLRSIDCGITMTNYLYWVCADNYPGATEYEYEFSNTGLGYNQTFTRPKAYRYVYVDKVPGIQNNTTYDVRIRAKKGGIWSNYGVVCQITTPASSITTHLRPADCGVIMPSYSSFILCEYVAGATEYEYEFSNVGLGYTQTYTRPKSWRYVWVDKVPGIQLSTTYDVRIRAKIGGIYTSYGATCQITTPASARIGIFPEDEEPNISNINTKLEMKMYPNPNQGEFVYLELQGLSANSEIIVTDIFGKTILNQPIDSDYETYSGTLRFNQKLDSGFYLITIISNNNKVTKKLVVR